MIIASVKSRAGLKKGRGFSEEEIKKAGLTVAVVRKMKIAVDIRRTSAHDSNVAELKKLKLPEKKPKVKKPVKKAEEKPVKAPAKTLKPEKKVAKKPVAKAEKAPKKAAPKKPAKKKAAPKSKVTKPKKK